jgi:hypothetical protein
MGLRSQVRADLALTWPGLALAWPGPWPWLALAPQAGWPGPWPWPEPGLAWPGLAWLSLATTLAPDLALTWPQPLLALATTLQGTVVGSGWAGGLPDP